MHREVKEADRELCILTRPWRIYDQFHTYMRYWMRCASRQVGRPVPAGRLGFHPALADCDSEDLDFPFPSGLNIVMATTTVTCFIYLSNFDLESALDHLNLVGFVPSYFRDIEKIRLRVLNECVAEIATNQCQRNFATGFSAQNLG